MSHASSARPVEGADRLDADDDALRAGDPALRPAASNTYLGRFAQLLEAMRGSCFFCRHRLRAAVDRSASTFLDLFDPFPAGDGAMRWRGSGFFVVNGPYGSPD